MQCYNYKIETKYGPLVDAIYHDGWTKEQLDIEITRRVSNFEYSIEHPIQDGE